MVFIINNRDWLKKIRLSKGLTQQDVAERSGIKRAYYTMIEQGKRNPSVSVAKSIAKALEMEWTFFFEYKCNKTTLISAV